MRELVRSVFLYSASGSAADADVFVRGTDPVTETNAHDTLNMRSVIARYEAYRDDPAIGPSVDAIVARLDEVPEPVRHEIERRRRASLVEGTVTEGYRRATVQDALDQLAGNAPRSARGHRAGASPAGSIDDETDACD
jgi:hypothetical protein